MNSFKPSRFMQNCHAQTILPSLISFRNPLKKTEQVVLVPMSNGDQIQVKLNLNGQTKKVVFLVHGLEGSSEARYMVQTAIRLFQEGYSTVRINLRNCGGTESLAKSLYNAGMSDDLDRVLHFFKNYQWDEIVLIGFSLGANLVGKYVGEKGLDVDPQIKKIILVSPPLDLNKTLLKMSQGLNWFYNHHFTYLLKAKYKIKCKIYPELFNKKILSDIKNLLDFDNKITGPYFGFQDAREYYAWGSSIRYIRNVKIPVYIIQSKDDPIVDASDSQELAKDSHEFIKVILTEKGGHVGFWGYGNGCQKAPSWLSHTILQLIHEP